MDMQNVSNLQISEGAVRTVHDKDNRLIWGRLAYDTKYVGNSEQRNLPSEYQQVEYLEDAGSQYINTGVVPYGQGFKFEIKFSYDTWVAYRSIYGNYVSEAANTVRLILGSTDNGGAYVTNMVKAGTSSQISGVQKGAVNTVVDTYSYTIVNGVSKTKTPFTPGTTNETPVVIFGRSVGSQLRDIGLKIYYQKIWNNDVLVRDFIPCYRKSDNKPGMYDTVNNVFYTNAGTGEFTVGADVTVPTPDTPIPVQVVTGEQTVTISDGVDSEAFPVSLGSLELCKIGTYQDYIYKSGDDWYVHKEVGKEQISPNKIGVPYQHSGGYATLDVHGNDYKRLNSGNEVSVKSDNFYGDSMNRTWLGTIPYSVSQASNGNYLQFSIPTDAIGTTQEEARAYFGNHPTIVYYALATPTDTQITDATLVGQLNAVHEWLTRYGYNATVTGDLPIVLRRDSLQ